MLCFVVVLPFVDLFGDGFMDSYGFLQVDIIVFPLIKNPAIGPSTCVFLCSTHVCLTEMSRLNVDTAGPFLFFQLPFLSSVMVCITTREAGSYPPSLSKLLFWGGAIGPGTRFRKEVK